MNSMEWACWKELEKTSNNNGFSLLMKEKTTVKQFICAALGCSYMKADRVQQQRRHYNVNEVNKLDKLRSKLLYERAYFLDNNWKRSCSELFV